MRKAEVSQLDFEFIKQVGNYPGTVFKPKTEIMGQTALKDITNQINTKASDKPVLCLDLDETLIHSVFQMESHNIGKRMQDKEYWSVIDGVET